jgi:hypothetical protein
LWCHLGRLFVLVDATGASTTDTLTVHTASCGDGTDTSETFKIATLNPDGSGTALFKCGSSCTWTFAIQLSADRSMFNLTDVTPADTSGRVAGVATRRSTGGNIVKANSSGAWQGTFIGHTNACGATSMQVNFTFSAAGASTKVTEVTHSALCGDVTTTDNAFTIQTLNADGSGTAAISCGTGCTNTLTFQVSPDRSMVNFSDVAPADVGTFWGGTLIHQ